MEGSSVDEAADVNFSNGPEIPGWTYQYNPAAGLNPATITLSRDIITYTITIPDEYDAKDTLRRVLEYLPEYTRNQKLVYTPNSIASGAAESVPLVLPLSELSRQFKYTMSVKLSEAEESLILHSPKNTGNQAEPVYMQLIEGESEQKKTIALYSPIKDGTVVITPQNDDSLSDESIQTALQGIANPSTEASTGEKAYTTTTIKRDPNRTMQFQNPVQPEQHIDGEKIAAAFGIPYDRGIVFQLFQKMTPQEQNVFVAENKEALSPELKFEDFRAGRYRYIGFSSKLETDTVRIGNKYVVGIPETIPSQQYTDLFTLLSSIETNIPSTTPEATGIAPGGASESFVKFYGYEHQYSYEVCENIKFTQISASLQIHEILLEDNKYLYFIKQIDASKAPVFLKIESPHKMELDQILSSIGSESTEHKSQVSPDYIQILNIEFEGSEYNIDTQKMSNYLKIPIINKEHARSIFTRLEQEQKKAITQNCLFESKSKAASAKSNTETTTKLSEAICRLAIYYKHKPDNQQEIKKCYEELISAIKGVHKDFQGADIDVVAGYSAIQLSSFAAKFDNSEIRDNCAEAIAAFISEANRIAPAKPKPMVIQKKTAASPANTEEAKKKLVADVVKLRKDLKTSNEILFNDLKAFIEEFLGSTDIEENKLTSALAAKFNAPLIGERKFKQLSQKYQQINQRLAEQAAVDLTAATTVLMNEATTAQDIISINRRLFFTNLSRHATSEVFSDDCMLAAKPILDLLQDAISINNKITVKNLSTTHTKELLQIILKEEEEGKAADIERFMQKLPLQGIREQLIRDIPEVAASIASASPTDSMIKTITKLTEKYKAVLSEKEIADIFSITEINKAMKQLQENQSDSLTAEQILANAMVQRVDDFIEQRKKNIQQSLTNLLSNSGESIDSKLSESLTKLREAHKKHQKFNEIIKGLNSIEQKDYATIKSYLSNTAERQEIKSKATGKLKEIIDKIDTDDDNTVRFLKLLLSDAFACPDVRLYVLNLLKDPNGLNSKSNQKNNAALLSRFGRSTVDNTPFIALKEFETILTMSPAQRSELVNFINKMSSSFGQVLDDSVVKTSAVDFSECADYYKLLAHALYTPFRDEDLSKEDKTQIIASMITPFLPDGADDIVTSQIIQLREQNIDSHPDSLLKTLDDISTLFLPNTDLAYKFSEGSIQARTPLQNLASFINTANFLKTLFTENPDEEATDKQKTLLLEILRSKYFSLDTALEQSQPNSTGPLQMRLRSLIFGEKEPDAQLFLTFLFSNNAERPSFHNAIALAKFIFQEVSADDHDLETRNKAIKDIAIRFMKEHQFRSIFSQTEYQLIKTFAKYMRDNPDNPELQELGRQGIQKIFGVPSEEGQKIHPALNKSYSNFIEYVSMIQQNKLITSSMSSEISPENFDTLKTKFQNHFNLPDATVFTTLDSMTPDQRKILNNCYGLINTNKSAHEHQAFAICSIILMTQEERTALINTLKAKDKQTPEHNKNEKDSISKAIDIITIGKIEHYISDLKYSDDGSIDDGNLLEQLQQAVDFTGNQAWSLSSFSTQQNTKQYSAELLEERVDYRPRPKKNPIDTEATEKSFTVDPNSLLSSLTPPSSAEPTPLAMTSSSTLTRSTAARSAASSLLTERLDKLIAEINASTHPNHLLNDLLHQKPSDSA